MSSPISRLQHLASTGSTGEFIAAANGARVHVYLQEGRVAWATTNTERLLFKRVLLETTRLSAAKVEEVSEQCDRDRRPLGETLVMSRLATTTQVRTALRVQIETALETLRQATQVETLFLPRRRTCTYEPRLTFGSEILSSFLSSDSGEFALQ